MTAASRRVLGRLARPLLMLAATPLFVGADCEQPLVTDSGFDVWCGDTLCSWQVDEGTISKVPTWHGDDFGVSMDGDATRISQQLSITNDDVGCLHFDLLASVDDAVNVALELDFDDDGQVDHREIIPSGDWIPLSYHITAPTYYRGLRISLRKSGAGRAALARIQASKSSSDCSGPPVATSNRPAGATCEAAADCAGGRCLSQAPDESLLPGPGAMPSVCEGCGGDGDCAAGTVCGVDFRDGFAGPFRACVAATTRLLGQRCIGGGECASGVCCGGICSACCAGTGPVCAGAGDQCLERTRDDKQRPVRAAWQCAPGGRRGGGDAPCLADDDCAGGHCAGGASLMVCAADGRPCASDTACPASVLDNSCIALGVAGGRCL